MPQDFFMTPKSRFFMNFRSFSRLTRKLPESFRSTFRMVLVTRECPGRFLEITDRLGNVDRFFDSLVVLGVVRMLVQRWWIEFGKRCVLECNGASMLHYLGVKEGFPSHTRSNEG